ncbi:MAG: 1,4-dihydroxy-2-naphthoate polyprenyltransferase [Bradymonadaceae bacterium]
MSSNAMVTPGSIKAWILAARPKTLAAAAIPVLVGSAVAHSQAAFVLLPALAALVGAGLIQVGTNFANDYFDYQSGADNEDRLGPTRAVQAGLLSSAAVKAATAGTFLAAAFLGIYLVSIGGWPILAIGIASILSGLAYTGGPYPLGYHGLGDIFVFVFFGLVAVMGTHYVQALAWAPEALIAAIPIGLLSTAILVVNNYRDIDTDRQAGKNTLAVRLGPRATRWQYVLTIAAAFAVPLLQWVTGHANVTILLPLLSFPLALLLIREIWRRTGTQLNALLARTAGLLAIFGVLYSLGLIL